MDIPKDVERALLTDRQRDALAQLELCGKLTAHQTRARGSVYRHGFSRATFDALVRMGAATRTDSGNDLDATWIYRPAKRHDG